MSAVSNVQISASTVTMNPDFTNLHSVRSAEVRCLILLSLDTFHFPFFVFLRETKRYQKLSFILAAYL